MIDALNADDLPEAARLSATFSWPHRPEDWAFFHGVGHGLAWREAGKLAGTAMWFPLDDAHAAIGLVQVAPELQGRGIGRQLMVTAMAAAAPRSLLLHATPAGAGLYARLGFVPDTRITQWQGECLPPVGGTTARRATSADHAAILGFDACVIGLARAPLLEACLRESIAMVTGPASALTGYAMRRRFGRGALIGPVVAVDEATAIDLVGALCEPGFLRVDVASAAGPLTNFLTGLGLRCVDEVQAMVKGGWPNPLPTRRFGLVAQALG